MQYLVGIDIGGTFTDFVAYDKASNQIRVWKNATTPSEPIEGVLSGLKRMENASDIEHLRLGTTIATNAILERRGATVAYVTTKGFKDIPFIQRGNRRSHYDISWIKTKPLVKRRHCFEVDERLSAKGETLVPLDDEMVRRLAAEIRTADGIEAIAVNCLFSYISPVHEQRIRDILAEELPDVPVSISFDVLPKWKEYERASTTIADAYVKPVVGRHFQVMQKRLDELGVGGRVVVIKSNGGESTLAGAAAQPVQMTVSGPTGGVVAAKALSRLVGVDNLVTFDMGGTSTDCATIIEGHENFTTNFEIEWGVPIQVPMLDVRTIGAGGGSIAWIDKGGMLRVGPESAGADPGPACYGTGGEKATVTDANVVLGRINPHNFLGGDMPLDAEAAERAVAATAGALGLGVEETALAIVQIANNNMVGALRSVLLERGLDPRDFALLAFGGAGPVHANGLMTLAGVPRAIVPNYPGQFSAFGFIMTDARVDKQRTIHQTSARFDAEHATAWLGELVDLAVGELRDQGYADELQVLCSLDLRYLGQNYELELPYPGRTFDAAGLTDLWRRFHETHEARFGFQIPGETIEMVNLAVSAIAPSRKPELEKLAPAEGPPEPAARRSVRFTQSRTESPIYNRADLRAGHAIDGPAVIEEAASVTVVEPGHRVTVDDYGNLHIAS